MEQKAEEIRNPERSLALMVKEETGENVFACYQCLKCTAGCPMSFAMDYPPNQIIRMVQLGLKEELLNSKAIWICSSCYTCSVRCPNDIHIAHVIDFLRNLAIKEKVKTAEENVVLFHEMFLQSVSKYGRAYEAQFLSKYEMKTGKLIKNMVSGLKMFLKGRMAILPQKVKKMDEIKKIFSGSEVPK
ncbi:MAG: 4Fe-4S dicluster domain-containing protein [Deltaproteobacteria bacterium]|nr:4Fe-4S dicluster domain-containing protein [Deltaproteobacteria bacterium]